MKAIVILCEDKTYLERLVPAMQRGLPAEYSAEGYGSVEEYEAHRSGHPVKAVLLTEGCGSAEERMDLAAGMAARRASVWNLTENPELAESPGCLFRYRPVDRMLERILEATEPGTGGEQAWHLPQECPVIGVLALSGENSTAYAMACARKYAARGKTALLCINPWPDASKDWKPGENDVSELLYLLRESGSEWYRKEALCAKDCGTVKVISGYTCFADFGLFDEKDAEALLSGLEAGGYSCLVMDLTGLPTPVLAQRCRELHVLCAADGERFRALERMLREEGLADRLRRVVSAEAAG